MCKQLKKKTANRHHAPITPQWTEHHPLHTLNFIRASPAWLRSLLVRHAHHPITSSNMAVNRTVPAPEKRDQDAGLKQKGSTLELAKSVFGFWTRKTHAAKPRFLVRMQVCAHKR